MPSLDAIEQFNSHLKNLGSEPEILAERSEEMEDVPPPEQQLSQDLQDLLGPASEETPAGEEQKELTELDFASLFGEEAGEGLDELPPDIQAEEVAVPEAGAEEAAEVSQPEAEELSMEDLGLEPQEEAPGAEAAEEGVPGEEFEISELELPAEEAPGEEAPGEELEEAGVPEQELPEAETPEEGLLEDFSLPEGLLSEEEQLAEPSGEEQARADEEGVEFLLEEPGGEEAVPEEAPGVEAPGADVLEAAIPGVEGLEAEVPGTEVPEAEVPEAEAPESLGEFEPLEPAEVPAVPEEPAELPGAGEEWELPGEFPEEVPGEEVPPLEQEPFAAEEVTQEAVEEPLELDEELGTPTGDMGFGPIESVEEEQFQLDEFALPDEFVVEEAEIPAPTPPPRAAPAAPVPTTEEAAEEELEFTEREFQAIQATLASLPLNLKIAVEDLIGAGLIGGSNLKSLMDMLIQGRDPVELASLVMQITGREIVLPRRFEKKTGVAYEREKRTFAYAFQQNIFPILRIFVPAAVLVFFVGMAVNQFIITPARANAAYKIKRWFYQYADRFIEEEQYPLAEEKYLQLQRMYPGDKRGLLDHAKMESIHLARYEKAEELLNRLRNQDVTDYDALLAAGDNYLAWAEEDTNKFDQAKDAYFRILSTRSASRDEPWLHLLRYYIRRDQLSEVENLKNRFQAQKKVEVDAEIYAELGDYLLKNGRIDDVRDILTQALETDRSLPQTYYHFARYFRQISDPGKEEEALQFARRFLEEESPPSRQRMPMLIDTHNRQGEIHYGRAEYVKAEESFNRAIQLIEDGQARGILGKGADFGKVYYNRGDIFYYVNRDLNTADQLYQKADENGYGEPELSYKQGYIHYTRANYRDALLEFHSTSSDMMSNMNLLYSMGNTLYHRNDLFAAQGYYSRLLDILERRQSQIPILRPDEDPRHRALVEMTMKVHNNLGVIMKRLAEAPQDPERESAALVELTRSSEFFDILSRDPETLERGETKNLAYLNTRGILYPSSGFSLQIYNRIPRDTTSDIF
jgi:hypothetical protein